MNAQEILKSVKVLLGIEVKLSQMKLQDGTTIEAESFEVGFSVGIVTPEGIVVLPVGEHSLEDGGTIVVEVEGVIAAIKPIEEIAEPEMSAAPEAPSTEGQAKKIVESIVKESFFSMNKELTAEAVTLKSEIEKLKAEIVTLSAEPAVKAIVTNPEAQKSFKDMTPLEKFRAVKN